MRLDKRLIISVGIIWLFNISGIIGILLGYENWFLPLTPLNLIIYAALVCWNDRETKPLFLGLFGAFAIGMISETLGVQYGWFFGAYEYGNNLGFKVLDVPLMIGVNWAILVYCTAAISNKISSNKIIKPLLATVLMVALDMLLEVSAPRFDFWEFKGGIAPLQNYFGWFGVSLLAQIVFQFIKKNMDYGIAIHIFLAMTVFFTTFLFF